MLSPLVKTSLANAGGAGSVSGWGANPNSTCLTAKKKKQTNPKTQNRSNVATNSTEILKMVHIKKKKKKRKTKELFTDLSTEKMSYRGEGEHWNLMLQKSSHLQTNKGKPHPVDWHYLKG